MMFSDDCEEVRNTTTTPANVSEVNAKIESGEVKVKANKQSPTSDADKSIMEKSPKR